MFKITRRHYEKLIKQGYDNLPYETGGFLGGKDNTICAILPTFNKDWDETTDTFKIDGGDILRAHTFFEKHNLSFFGVYHTHPEGIAYPSPADINTGQKYHFIISYRDSQKPDFRVYQIINREPKELPLKVLEKGFDVKDIHGTSESVTNEQIEKGLEINERIQNIAQQKPNQYIKEINNSKFSNSDFSTLA